MKTFRFRCGEWSADIEAENIFDAMEQFQMWKDTTLDVNYSNYSRFDQFKNLSIDQLTNFS